MLIQTTLRLLIVDIRLIVLLCQQYEVVTFFVVVVSLSPESLLSEIEKDTPIMFRYTHIVEQLGPVIRVDSI